MQKSGTLSFPLKIWFIWTLDKPINFISQYFGEDDECREDASAVEAVPKEDKPVREKTFKKYCYCRTFLIINEQFSSVCKKRNFSECKITIFHNESYCSHQTFCHSYKSFEKKRKRLWYEFGIPEKRCLNNVRKSNIFRQN